MTKPLTRSQTKVLDYYLKHIEKHEYAPTYKEAGIALGKAESVIFEHIKNLCKMGFAEKLGNGYVRIIKKETYKLTELSIENKALKIENERLKKTIDKLIK